MGSTVTKLSTEAAHEIAQSLSYVLSDTFMLYMKTHTYHWNITGPNFFALHQMFEEQYTDMWESVDTIAERIRSIGEMAPHSQNIIEMSKIPSMMKNPTEKEMLKDLSKSHQLLIAELKRALSCAADAEDDATAGILTDRIITHEKFLWMIQSSLK